MVVVIGNRNGRILSKIPNLLDDTGVLEFGLDEGDLLDVGGNLSEVGDNLIEVHIIMPNDEKFVAPSSGHYKLRVTRSIDTLGEKVTTVTLDYFLDEANRVLDDMNTKVEYVNQTAEDLRQEVGENLDSLVTQEVDNKMTPFVEDVNERLAEATRELENKVSISTFESGLSTKRDKGIKLDERDMSDEFLQQIAGNTPIHSVPADLSVDAGKLLLPNTDVVWELGNVSYSGGVDQDLEGYIRTKDYIYAPKGTTILSTDNQNYKYSIHLYDLETKTRFERVWEPPETRYTVSESCYIRLTVRTNPIVAITQELFDIMKNILTINKLLNKMDIVESIEEAKGDGRNTFIPLACFEMYNDNTRAQSIDGIPINNAATFTVINKTSDFSIGIRQRDADGKIVIDNGWTVKNSRRTFTKESGTETIQIVFGKSDNSKFTLNDIPINLFEVQFDGENENQMEYFNTYVVEYFTRGDKGSNEISVLNPLNASIKAINHRGYDTHPENTMPAYKKSKDMGFSYVEADVRWTSDNIPVLLHDATINRTGRNADGTEISETINISDITYEEALNYDFGIYKGAEFAGTKIPTLEEFITLCKRLNLHPYIELKGGTDTQIIDAVNVVRKKGMLDKCSWLSSVSICAKVLAEYPKARVVVVTNSTDSAVIDSIAELKTNENDVAADFYIGNITQSMVEYAHSKGIHAEVWTTDNEEDIKKLADWGIDGITTNHSNIAEILNYL